MSWASLGRAPTIKHFAKLRSVQAPRLSRSSCLHSIDKLMEEVKFLQYKLLGRQQIKGTGLSSVAQEAVILPHTNEAPLCLTDTATVNPCSFWGPKHLFNTSRKDFSGWFDSLFCVLACVSVLICTKLNYWVLAVLVQLKGILEISLCIPTLNSSASL